MWKKLQRKEESFEKHALVHLSGFWQWFHRERGMSKLATAYTLNICNLLHVSYTLQVGGYVSGVWQTLVLCSVSALDSLCQDPCYVLGELVQEKSAGFKAPSLMSK